MGASLAIAEADARKDWLGAPPPRPHVPAHGLIFTNPWAWTSPRPPGPSTSPGQHGGPGPKSPLVQPGLSSRLTSLCPQRAAAAGVRPAQVRREAGGGASGGQVNAQVTTGDGRRPPGPPRPPEHPDKATTAPRCLVFPPSGGCRCCQDGETQTPASSASPPLRLLELGSLGSGGLPSLRPSCPSRGHCRAGYSNLNEFTVRSRVPLSGARGSRAGRCGHGARHPSGTGLGTACSRPFSGVSLAPFFN